MRVYFQLKTIDPIIISQSNATTNNHNSCDFIPGSAILGALAAQLYPKLTLEQSWQLFHSGESQFGSCYPLEHNEICLPVPASWHIEKNNKPVIKKRLSNKVTHINGIDYDRKGIQFQQLRTGFVSSSGQVADVKIGQVTKTAINNKTGTVEQGQLYTYSFIEQQQNFIGWVDVADEFLDQVTQALMNISRVGRAKNAEFGRVSISVIKAEQPQIKQFNNKLVLWCLSDCEFITEFGNNCLAPIGSMLDDTLAGITLNTEQSYIRSHSISRFNQKRAGFDSQAHVVSKGSMLVFDLNEQNVDLAILNQLAAKGVGINKQFGQGWVSVNPKWWQQVSLEPCALFSPFKLLLPSIKESKDTQLTSLTSLTSLTNWVTEQLKGKVENAALKKEVLDSLSIIEQSYRNARTFNSIRNGLQAGPSANQWRRIYEKVKHDEEQWQQDVFTSEHRICNAKNDELGWGIQWQEGTKFVDFETQITNTLKSKSVAFMHLFLEQLCEFDPSTFSGLKALGERIAKERKDLVANNKEEQDAQA